MMVLKNNLKLRLEPNSFGSIRLSVLKDKKVLPSNSIDIPSDIRQLSRYSMSKDQFLKMLIDFLNDNPDFPLEVKVKHVFFDCFWDKNFVNNDVLTIELAQEKVFIHQLEDSYEKFVFSKQFCLDIKQARLGLYAYSSTSPSHNFLNHLKLNQPQKKSSSKPVPANKVTNMSFTISEFNSNADFSFDVIPAGYFNFYQENMKHSFKEMETEYRLKINYDFNDVLVKLSPQIYFNEFDLPISKTFFADCINIRFDWSQNLSEKEARLVVLIFIYFFKAEDNVRKDRLKNHFLEKIIKDKKAYADVISFLNTIDSSVSRYRLIIDETSFYWAKVSLLKELILSFCLNYLFYFDFINKDDNDCYVVISKDSFHKKLDKLKIYLAAFDIALHFGDLKVEIEDHDVVIDCRTLDNEQLPEIYFDNELVQDHYFKGLEQNIWSYVNKDTIKVINPKTVTKIKEILNMIQFKRSVKTQTAASDIMKSLHILDWVQMKQLGIKVLLTDQQQEMMNSFLNFKELSSITPPEKMKSLARSYQVKCLGWLDFIYRFRLGGILADDMGLGKTFQTIMFLALLKEGKIKNLCPAGQHVIVVPPSLVFNWDYEINKFYPNLSVCIYSGINREWDDSVDVVIVTYDLLRREIDFLEKKTINVLVFDEAQLLKNKLSERTKAANRLNNHFVLCLTGTPIENNLLEYYTIFDLAVPNLFGPFAAYNQLIKQKKYKHIINRSKPFILRRLKTDLLLELPKKSEQTIFLNISEAQQQYYDAVVEQVKELIGKRQNATKKQPFSQIIALNLLLRLRQICVSPALIDETFNELTPKFIFLKERLSILKSEGYSSLVFSQFTKSLDLAEELCKKNGFNYFRLDGSTPLKKRKQMITEFQSSTEPQVFLISLKAGGMGLNLTKASYVFHLDPWWNPAVEAQATDRTHRIGQERQVFSFRLAMHNTVEEKILEMNDKKRDLFNMFFEDSQIVKRKNILTDNDLAYLVDNV